MFTYFFYIIGLYLFLQLITPFFVGCGMYMPELTHAWFCVTGVFWVYPPPPFRQVSGQQIRGSGKPGSGVFW